MLIFSLFCLVTKLYNTDLLQDKDAFLQAAKRTPVDLEGWARSMVDKYNRKSYLGPPAPKSLRGAQTPTSNPSPSPVAAPTSATIGKPLPISKSSRTPTSSDPRIANEYSSNPRYYEPQPQAQPQTQSQPQSSHYYSSSGSTRSPQPPSLENLSLEEKDDGPSRVGRPPMRQRGEPASAIDSRNPMSFSRSASSHNYKYGTSLSNSTMPLPLRAPPPNGLPPTPPVPAGGNWRSQPGATPR
jgi:mitogen-activated protein kinase kinase